MPYELHSVAQQVIRDFTNFYVALRGKVPQITAEQHGKEILNDEVLLNAARAVVLGPNCFIHIVDGD